MTRSISPLEFSAFTKGLITDGSPLNQEPDSAREMSNFDLDIDGTIKRRQGLTKQSPLYPSPFTDSVDSVLTTPVASSDDYKDVVAQTVQQFGWSGLGVSEDVDINVTLIGDTLTFQKVGGATVEGVVIDNKGVDEKSLVLSQPTGRTVRLPIAQLGKKLVVAQPGISFVVLTYEGDKVVVGESYKITVRDLWGVSSVDDDGVDYTAGSNLNKRPPRLTHRLEFYVNYFYNLRNQGFNVARFRARNVDTFATDPINIWIFENDLTISYPAMADSVSPYLHPDTSLTEATRDRYHAKDSFADSPSSTRAPRGAYLIDLADRVGSRKQAMIDGFDLHPQETQWNGSGSVDLLTSDTSSIQEMPRAMGEFAGRLWFTGFSDAGTDAHSESPDLSSLVFFSQLNTAEANLFKCYQEGDPTSKEAPDVVATDGGFISILGMGGAGKLVEFGNSLVVFAKTGIWAIVGTDSGGFSATGFEVRKLSSTGTELFNSVVLSGDSLTYLSGDGVYSVQMDEVGELRAGKVSQGVLDNLFTSLSSDKLRTAAGAYSEGEREIRWLMHDSAGAKELKFKLALGAFSLNDYPGDLFDGKAAIPVSLLPLPFTSTFNVTGNIVIGADVVVVGSDQVVSTSVVTGDNPRDFLYLIAQRGEVPTEIQYGLATQEGATFTDFPTFNIPADSNWSTVVGSDAAASLLMSHYTGGDTQRSKSVTYLTTLFKKTETGFDVNFNPIGESSCLVQAQWDWADSAASNKFGRKFQAYRHRRLFMPDNINSFDNGHEVVTTKNKLRGKGKALSLKFETEPGLDCHILGWSMNMSIENAV